jgi:site-specific recombinase XerD
LIEVHPIKNKKQIEKMKRALKADNLRDYCLFVLGINIGLRISDLLNLKVKDLMDGRKVKKAIRIKEFKTGKTKIFQINQNASQSIHIYLADIKDFSEDMFIFKSRKGTNAPISRVQAWQILSNCAENAGIKEKIGTHTLRKTFGYWAYKQGIDITLLQKIFNHSAPSITLRYIGITQDDINDVYINLNL